MRNHIVVRRRAIVPVEPCYWARVEADRRSVFVMVRFTDVGEWLADAMRSGVRSVTFFGAAPTDPTLN